MNDSDRISLFNLLSLTTTALSITAMTVALYGNWRWVAGIAVLACLLYQIHIWLITPLVKK